VVTALVGIAGLAGLVVGSFLNVVISRVPRGESVVRPPSHCPACGAAVRARHNVPVVGWLVLRGRCADCRATIGIRYPAVELGTGVAFAGLTAWLGARHLLGAAPAYLCFVAAGIALAMIDLDCRRLPTVIVLPCYPVLAALLATASWWQRDWWPLARAAIGGGGLFAFFFAVAFAYPAGMGFGDVRLAGVVGGMLGYLSWSTLVVGAFGAFLLGSVVGLVIMAIGGGGRRTAVPFGPFMIVAALLAIVVADPVVTAYRGLLGGG
jgi:leader peptidase (prepilin peptidase)/N-methyltransferase